MKLEEYEMDMTLPISKITVKAIPTENIKEKIKELKKQLTEEYMNDYCYPEEIVNKLLNEIFGAELCSGVEE